MTGWEYLRLDLGQLPRDKTETDLLNEAGNAGWECITILVNNVAILKRQLTPPPAPAPVRRPATTRARATETAPESKS